MIIHNATYHAPLALITATDKSAAILIVNIIALIISLASVAVRFFISNRKTGAGYTPFRDDWLCYVSVLLSCALFAIVWISTSAGNGKTLKDISEHNLVKLQRLQYAIDLLSIAALFCSRASVIFLIHRLQGTAWNRSLRVALAALVLSGLVVSIFLISLKCDLSHPWIEYNAQCTGLLARWIFVEVFGIVVEICMFGLLISIIYRVNLRFSSKLKVILLFGTRALVLIFAGLRLHAIPLYYHSSDPTLAAALANAYLLAEVHASIITATTPLLKSFFLEFKVVGQRQTFLPPKNNDTPNFHNEISTSTSTVQPAPIRKAIIKARRKKKVRLVEQNVTDEVPTFSTHDTGSERTSKTDEIELSEALGRDS